MFLFGLPPLVIKDPWMFSLFALPLGSQKGGKAFELCSVLPENHKPCEIRSFNHMFSNPQVMNTSLFSGG